MANISEEQLINFIRQNVEAGLNGIDLVVNTVKTTKMKTLLESQRTQYSGFYAEADTLLHKKNYTPENMPITSKMSAAVMGTVKKVTDRTDSDIADTMITGATMGVTKLTKHLHEYDGNVQETVDLANRVLTFEQDSIEQLKAFL